MTIYLVSVRTPLNQRWIDSLWVVHSHAVNRSRDLEKEFRRTGKKVATDEWWTWVSEATAPDGELSGQGSPEGEPPQAEQENGSDLEGLELDARKVRSA